jgi:hypothetical protein
MGTRFGSSTLVFWGAGATQSTGLRTTLCQASAIKGLVTDSSDTPLSVRVNAALGNSANPWVTPFSDLLLVLGDDIEREGIHTVSNGAREAMARHWYDCAQGALEARIHQLRATFDWPALKEIVRICPGFHPAKDGLQLQDVFNVIDLHAHSFHGFRASGHFLPPDRLVAARRALQLIINTLFFIDWHTALSDKKSELEKHLGFARLLTEHHQHEGVTKAATRQH